MNQGVLTLSLLLGLPPTVPGSSLCSQAQAHVAQPGIWCPAFLNCEDQEYHIFFATILTTNSMVGVPPSSTGF